MNRDKSMVIIHLFMAKKFAHQNVWMLHTNAKDVEMIPTSQTEACYFLFLFSLAIGFISCFSFALL